MKSLLILWLLLFSLPLWASNRYAVVLQDPAIFYSSSIGEKTITKRGWLGKSMVIKNVRSGRFQVEHDGEALWFPVPPEKQSPSDFIVSSESLDYVFALKKDAVVRKGLIVNRINSRDYDESQIAFYRDSNLRNEIGKISIYEVRFVFAEKDGAILLGRSDMFFQDNAKDVLVGWFSKEKVIHWNTRIGLEFNKTEDFIQRRNQTGLFKVYNQERNLLRVEQGRLPEPVLVEDDSDQSPEYFMNRMPLVDAYVAATKKKPGFARDFYKFAYIGDAKGDGKIVTQEEIARGKQTINEVLSNNTLQIAILIDATQGMQDHIGNVKAAVQQFLSANIGENEVLAPEIAIAVYRDFADGSDVFRIHSPFTNDFRRIQRAISEIRAFSSPTDKGVGAYPEAMFHGIKQTLSQLDWQKRKGEKFILVIGDHGDHGDRDTAHSIAKKLREQHTALHGVQVHITSGLKQYNDRFESQILQIKEGNDGVGSFVPVRNNSQKNILLGLNAAATELEVIKQALLDARTGVLNTKLLARYGVDPATFNALQLCDIGFAFREVNGIPVFVESVLMKKTEAEDLKIASRRLSDAVRRFGQPGFDEKFKRTVFQIIKDLTGDELPSDAIISDFLEKKAGIPIQTQLLSYTVNDLLRQVTGESFRKKIRKYLEDCILELEEVTNERHLEDARWVDSDMTWSFLFGEEKPYFFNIEQPIPKRKGDKRQNSQKLYAWVPLSAIP